MPDYGTRWSDPYWQSLLTRSTAQHAQAPVPGQARLRSPEALRQRPEYQFATQGTVPEGFHLGPDGFPIKNPGFSDWMYKYLPAIIGAAGTAGLASGGALAGTSLATQAGAHGALNAGMSAASGGSLKDVALAGATGAAGAGTGGGTMASWVDLFKDPDTYAAIASIAGRAAGSKSDQRMQEGQQTATANNTELARYQTEQAAQNQAAQLDLQRKMFSEDARGGRAKQAALADLISNLQDISINVPGVQTANVTGGLRPSALGSTGRQGMAELGKQALAKLLEGDQFTGGEILKGPSINPMPKRGGVETALDWIGLLGAGAGALGNINERGTYSTLPNTQQPAAVMQNQRRFTL